MEELKKLNVKIAALCRSINHLNELPSLSDVQVSILALRKKELMVARGKRTRLIKQTYEAA